MKLLQIHSLHIAFVLMVKVDECGAELQKRADRADQSVLFFLAGANFLGKAREKLLIFGKSTQKTANFWEKHAKNC